MGKQALSSRKLQKIVEDSTNICKNAFVRLGTDVELTSEIKAACVDQVIRHKIESEVGD